MTRYTLQDLPRRYAEAADMLDARTKRQKSNSDLLNVGPNTTLRDTHELDPATGEIAPAVLVRYHATDIVTFHASGWATLGAYFSNTTNDRYSIMGMPTIYQLSRHGHPRASRRVQDTVRWAFPATYFGHQCPVGLPAVDVVVNERREFVRLAHAVGGEDRRVPMDLVADVSEENHEAWVRKVMKAKRRVMKAVKPILRALEMQNAGWVSVTTLDSDDVLRMARELEGSDPYQAATEIVGEAIDQSASLFGISPTRAMELAMQYVTPSGLEGRAPTKAVPSWDLGPYIN